MASELKIESHRGGSVMSELPISTLRQIVWGDNMDLDKSVDVDELPNPFEQLKHDGAVRAALRKSDQRPNLILDMSVPQSDVDEHDFELYKTPTIIPGLRKPSGQGFVKAIATIRRVFAGHDDEMNEAIEIVTRMRDEERAAMIAQIAAAQ
jgi:hypothetical protein